MRILAQVPPGMAFKATRCRVYLNLFLNLTEEGLRGVIRWHYKNATAPRRFLERSLNQQTHAMTPLSEGLTSVSSVSQNMSTSVEPLSRSSKRSNVLWITISESRCVEEDTVMKISSPAT